jgi:ABC-type uncharacterized transport system ATPase subunit
MIAGDVGTVRRSTGRQVVRFAVDGDPDLPWLASLPDVGVQRRREDHVELSVPDEERARAVLRAAIDRGLPVTRFEISYPSLNDVFLGAVRRLPDDTQPTERELHASPDLVTV